MDCNKLQYKIGKYEGVSYGFYKVGRELNDFLQKICSGDYYFQHAPESPYYGKLLFGAIHESKIDFTNDKF